MASPKRRIHLGIDYGTSTSKIVVRDYGAPGGELATPVLNHAGQGFPSTVALIGNTLVLGAVPAPGANTTGSPIFYNSVKMRVADELKGQEGRHCYGAQPTLPPGVTAADLAVLTVWCLISEGKRWLVPVTGIEYSIGMTLGVPMSFYNDQQLREGFLRIARAAWFLFKKNGTLPTGTTITLEQARQHLIEAYKHVDQSSIPTDQVRDWIRSEAEAAMWWAFQAPDVPAGLYAKVDIGAGTTNASMFRIVDEVSGGRWAKAKLAFFGSDSIPVGMDAVDEALARWQGISTSQYAAIRTKENKLLAQAGSRAACDNAISGIVSASRKAWQRGYQKIMGSQHERKIWNASFPVFTIGGGSLVDSVRDAVTIHPNENQKEEQLIPQPLSCPQDLKLQTGARVPPSLLPFVQVAYGLSVIALSIPEAKTPDDIPPITKPSERLPFIDADDIYGK